MVIHCIICITLLLYLYFACSGVQTPRLGAGFGKHRVRCVRDTPSQAAGADRQTLKGELSQL